MKKTLTTIVFQLATTTVFATGIAYGATSRSTTVMNEINTYNAALLATDKEAKYCKMAESPFGFYRGSNHLFWKDMINDTRLTQYRSTSGSSATKTWIQGDMHIENMGTFHDDDNEVVYGINDFDESLIADYQYDVWRMATSLVLVMKEKGYSSSSQDSVLEAFSEAYLDQIHDYVGNNNERTKQFDATNTGGKDSQLDNFLVEVKDRDGGDKSAREEMLDEWSDDIGSTRAFDLNHDDLQSTTASVESSIYSNFNTYKAGVDETHTSYFALHDVAKRINAGTGSLGAPRYYTLIEGVGTGEKDDIILDMKRQSKPTAYAYLSSADRTLHNSRFSNEAIRHTKAYRAMGTDIDNYLGTITISSEYYSVRELSPYKEKFDLSELTTVNRFKKIAQYWGQILATSHARSDNDYSSTYINYSFEANVDALTDTHHSEFNTLVKTVAKAYATQVTQDYGYFISAFDESVCP